jgi:BASS family bile acid:Na+ symporter
MGFIKALFVRLLLFLDKDISIMLANTTRLFPLWAALFSVIAYFFPSMFVWIKPGINYLLMLVMFTMGITLRLNDFRRVLINPAPVAAGICIHYTIMPLAALGLSWLLNMPPDLAAGMVLVGAVASGTASNVMTYLARGDLALSVTLSAISTLVGVVATPILTYLYVDTSIDVPIKSMLVDILKIVILPIALGLIINHSLPAAVKKVEPYLPLSSMICILAILACVVALSHKSIASMGLIVAAGVFLHNSIGLLAGYWGGKLLGFNEKVCRTLSIEVGMQNSGLAAILATTYFSPLAALPGALFSIWHNISGSLLAGYWRDKPLKDGSGDEPK